MTASLSVRDSGKLVIIGILALALTAAGASWLFRYAATNKTSRFWGPPLAQRIRDAPIVELHTCAGERMPAEMLAKVGDISHAPGLTHLRHALLENRSFVWPARTLAIEPRWFWALVFRNKEQEGMVIVLFTEDCRYAALSHARRREVISCEPISAGLREMFEEMLATFKLSR